MNEENIIKSLQQYVATYKSGKYANWEEINSKFPEFKDFDKKALQEYVATYESGQYATWELINSKFPEFFSGGPLKKKDDGENQNLSAQGSGVSSEANAQTAGSQSSIKPQPEAILKGNATVLGQSNPKKKQLPVTQAGLKPSTVVTDEDKPQVIEPDMSMSGTDAKALAGFIKDGGLQKMQERSMEENRKKGYDESRITTFTDPKTGETVKRDAWGAESIYDAGGHLIKHRGATWTKGDGTTYRAIRTYDKNTGEWVKSSEKQDGQYTMRNDLVDKLKAEIDEEKKNYIPILEKKGQEWLKIRQQELLRSGYSPDQINAMMEDQTSFLWKELDAKKLELDNELNAHIAPIYNEKAQRYSDITQAQSNNEAKIAEEQRIAKINAGFWESLGKRGADAIVNQTPKSFEALRLMHTSSSLDDVRQSPTGFEDFNDGMRKSANDQWRYEIRQSLGNYANSASKDELVRAFRKVDIDKMIENANSRLTKNWLERSLDLNTVWAGMKFIPNSIINGLGKAKDQYEKDYNTVYNPYQLVIHGALVNTKRRVGESAPPEEKARVFEEEFNSALALHRQAIYGEMQKQDEESKSLLENVPTTWDDAKASGQTAGYVGGAIGMGLGTSAVGMGISVAAGGNPSLGLMAIAANTANMYTLEAGMAYDEYLKAQAASMSSTTGTKITPEDLIKNGQDKDAAKFASQAGVFNAGLEQIGFMFGAGKMATSLFTKKFIEHVTKKNALQMATAFTGGVLGSIAAEGSTEGLQELTTIINDRRLNGNEQNGFKPMSIDEAFLSINDKDLDRIGESFRQGAIAGGTLGSLGSLADSYRQRNINKVYDQVSKYSDEQLDALSPLTKKESRDVKINSVLNSMVNGTLKEDMLDGIDVQAMNGFLDDFKNDPSTRPNGVDETEFNSMIDGLVKDGQITKDENGNLKVKDAATAKSIRQFVVERIKPVDTKTSNKPDVATEPISIEDVEESKPSEGTGSVQDPVASGDLGGVGMPSGQFDEDTEQGIEEARNGELAINSGQIVDSSDNYEFTDEEGKKRRMEVRTYKNGKKAVFIENDNGMQQVGDRVSADVDNSALLNSKGEMPKEFEFKGTEDNKQFYDRWKAKQQELGQSDVTLEEKINSKYDNMLNALDNPEKVQFRSGVLNDVINSGQVREASASRVAEMRRSADSDTRAFGGFLSKAQNALSGLFRGKAKPKMFFINDSKEAAKVAASFGHNVAEGTETLGWYDRGLNAMFFVGNDTRAVLHETIMHPIVDAIKQLQPDLYKAFVSEVSDIFLDPAAQKYYLGESGFRVSYNRLSELGGYQGKKVGEEALVQFLTDIANNRITDAGIIQRIADAIRNLLANLGIVDTEQIDLSSPAGAREIAGQIASAIASGRKIEVVNGSEQASGQETDLNGNPVSFSQRIVPDAVRMNPSYFENAKDFANSSAFDNKVKFKEAIQKRFLADLPRLRKIYGRNLNPQEYNELTKRYLSDVLTQEAVNAIAEHPEAIGWYDQKTKDALAVISLMHPEIETDYGSRGAFILDLAITSNGNKVNKNFEYAEQGYEYYSKNEKFDDKAEYGAQQVGIQSNFEQVNAILSNGVTMEELTDFMRAKIQAGKLKYREGNKLVNMVTGELATEEVYGASIIGAKIGNGFLMNLWGQFDQLTMDRWFMRTWGRLTGTLIEKDQENLNKGRVRLQDALAAVKKDDKAMAALKAALGNSKLEKSDKGLAEQIRKISADKNLREILSKNELTNQLRLASNTYAKQIAGEKEAPKNGQERKFIREVFRDVQQRLQSEHGIGIEMADLQAVLWYPEKILYESFQSGRNFDEVAKKFYGGNQETSVEEDDGEVESGPPDYYQAARNLAIKKGYSKQAIDEKVAQSRDNRRNEGGIPASEIGLGGDQNALTADQRDRLSGTLQAIRESQGGERQLTVRGNPVVDFSQRRNPESIQALLLEQSSVDQVLSSVGITEQERQDWKNENRRDVNKNRNPFVQEALRKYKDGEITQQEYIETVRTEMPIGKITNPKRPATFGEIALAIDGDKIKNGIIGLTKEVPDGSLVSLRLDIPAYNFFDIWVPTIHEFNTGKVAGYASAAKIRNVAFSSSPSQAMKVAEGTSKSPFAKMDGEFVNSTPEDLYQEALAAMSDPQWVQVGMNPERHSWFYDRSNGNPIVSADEVIQVGSLVLAKNPVMGNVNDDRFDTKQRTPQGDVVSFSQRTRLNDTAKKALGRDDSPYTLTKEHFDQNVKSPQYQTFVQDAKDKAKDYAGMSEYDLSQEVQNMETGTLYAHFANNKGNQNLSILALIELFKRAEQKGDSQESVRLFDQIKTIGSSVGQLLRQMRALYSEMARNAPTTETSIAFTKNHVKGIVNAYLKKNNVVLTLEDKNELDNLITEYTNAHRREVEARKKYMAYRSKSNYEKLQNATNSTEAAYADLDEFMFRKTPPSLSRYSDYIKGALLTFGSIVVNVGANAVNVIVHPIEAWSQPALRTAAQIMGFNYVSRSLNEAGNRVDAANNNKVTLGGRALRAAGRALNSEGTNIVQATKASAFAAREMVQNLWPTVRSMFVRGGMKPDDIRKYNVDSQIRPFVRLKQVLRSAGLPKSWVGNDALPKAYRMNNGEVEEYTPWSSVPAAILEGLYGWVPMVMFKGLYVTDRPFKASAKMFQATIVLSDKIGRAPTWKEVSEFMKGIPVKVGEESIRRSMQTANYNLYQTGEFYNKLNNILSKFADPNWKSIKKANVFDSNNQIKDWDRLVGFMTNLYLEEKNAGTNPDLVSAFERVYGDEIKGGKMLMATREDLESINLYAERFAYSDETSWAAGRANDFAGWFGRAADEAERKDTTDAGVFRNTLAPFLRVLGTTLQPYSTVPSNVVKHFVEMIFPMLPLAQAPVRYKRGDISGGDQMVGRAYLGLMLYGFGAQLIANGLIVAGDDEEDREGKSLKQIVGGEKSINVSGLRRMMFNVDGGDPTARLNDTYAPLRIFGIVGLFVDFQSRLKEELKNRNLWDESYFDTVKNNSLTTVLGSYGISAMNTTLEMSFLHGHYELANAIVNPGKDSAKSHWSKAMSKAGANIMETALVPLTPYPVLSGSQGTQLMQGIASSRGDRPYMLKPESDNPMSLLGEKLSARSPYPVLNKMIDMDTESELLPRLNFWGEPTEASFRQYNDPSRSRKVGDEAALKLYQWLESSGANNPVSFPERSMKFLIEDTDPIVTIGDDGKPKIENEESPMSEKDSQKLSEELQAVEDGKRSPYELLEVDYALLLAMSGAIRKQLFSEVMFDPDWDLPTTTDDERMARLKDANTRANAVAKRAFIQYWRNGVENQEILVDVLNKTYAYVDKQGFTPDRIRDIMDQYDAADDLLAPILWPKEDADIKAKIKQDSINSVRQTPDIRMR